MKKVILDVDTGIDDALALILAIKSEKLDVIGVTTVAGNVGVQDARKNTLKILKLLDREDIEVYEGCKKPISREIEFHGFIHGRDGLAGELKDLDTKEKNDIHAVEYIIDSISSSPGEITLIMLGPLTNLAVALENEAEIAEKIKEVYIMGGAARVPGNITPLAEFNFYKDPESAYKVLHSGLDIKLIGLDVTNHARLGEGDLERIDKKGEYGEFLYNISKYYIDRSEEITGERTCALHDPLVVAASLDRGILEYEKVFVDLEYSSRISDGQLVAYFARKGYSPNVDLAVSIDEKRFKDLFLEIMSKDK